MNVRGVRVVCGVGGACLGMGVSLSCLGFGLDGACCVWRSCFFGVRGVHGSVVAWRRGMCDPARLLALVLVVSQFGVFTFDSEVCQICLVPRSKQE